MSDSNTALPLSFEPRLGAPDSSAVEALQQLARALAPLVGDQLRKHGRSIEKRLLTVPEVAEYLGRSEESIRHLLRSQKLRAVRADGRVLIDRRDVDYWIETNKR